MVRESELAGIDRDWVKDGFWGLLIGVAILFAGFLIPGIGTIGIPSLPQSLADTTSRLIVIVFLASIFETFFFFDLVLSFFKDKLKRFGIKIPFVVAAILSGVVFSSFHLASYGSLESAGGSFFTAFIMGIVFAYQRKFFKSNIPGVLTHMVLNFWIGFGSGALVIG